MTRISPWKLYFAVLGILMVTLSSCRRPPVAATCDQLGNATEPVFVEKPVSYCWQKPLQLKTGKVQVLVDTSGSMIGFQHEIAPLVNWVRHGVSQVQQSAMNVQTTRLCQFSEAFSASGGLANCADLASETGDYKIHGDTNLHQAIRSAKDYELTYIITDGVAATGGRGASDCAGGVDAACVARALREVIHTQSPEGNDLDRGLWVIPLLANYDGTFYTEEPIFPTNFNAEDTIKQVRADIGVNAVVQNPGTGSDGRLQFKYQGPRSMLLIVIARWADVGRASVQALWERAEYLGVKRVEEMKQFSSELACFTPIEVYPGFLNQVRWDKLRSADDPKLRRGTMDATLETAPGKQSIVLECPKESKEAPGQDAYLLTGSTSGRGQIAGCVPLRLLPALTFGFRSVDPKNDSVLHQFLLAYESTGGAYESLKICLACTNAVVRPCGENPISVQWTAFMNYAKSADALADERATSTVPQSIKNLSTAHPSREPHRIFAFSATLEAFYREVTQDQRSVILSNLEICHKR